MCGIFGNFNINDANIFYDLGKYSETRGKEASGSCQDNREDMLVREP